LLKLNTGGKRGVLDLSVVDVAGIVVDKVQPVRSHCFLLEELVMTPKTSLPHSKMKLPPSTRIELSSQVEVVDPPDRSCILS
jgi:hypothetical protein